MKKIESIIIKEVMTGTMVNPGSDKKTVGRLWNSLGASTSRGRLWERIMDRARNQFVEDRACWRPHLAWLGPGILQSTLILALITGSAHFLSTATGLGFMATRRVEKFLPSGN